MDINRYIERGLIFILFQKVKDISLSVLPITFIVLGIHFTVVPLSNHMLIRFLLGAFLIVIGLTVFLFGVDKGIQPLGHAIGKSIVKTNKLKILIISGLILGFVISMAEPGLIVFAKQVELVTTYKIDSTTLLIVVSIGIASILAFAFYRVVHYVKLQTVFIILYIVILILSIFTEPEMLVIAFDASGSTTGILTVPFILAVTFGLSRLNKKRLDAENNSFGTIGVVSAGAIISVLLLSIMTPNTVFSGYLDVDIDTHQSLLYPFTSQFLDILIDSFIVFIPLVVVAVGFQLTFMKLKGKMFIKMIKGFLYAFIGLTIFLLGVNAGFTDVGTFIGHELAIDDNRLLILIVSFVLGLFTVLAEPAVHVLTKQIEETTSGSITKQSVLFALALGVGLAVMLSMLRVYIKPLQIWHYLVPGYVIALSLMFFIPKVFIGIAFDAGGVATGPITATFILAFMQGAAEAVDGANVILDGFGMIAMVALTPIITLEILGLIFKLKSKKVGVKDA